MDKRKKLLTRFKKLSFWNKFFVIVGVLSILPLSNYVYNYVYNNFINPYDLVIYIDKTDFLQDFPPNIAATNVFLSQGCNSTKRILYYSNRPHSVSKYDLAVPHRIISLSKCPSCKYIITARNLGRVINEESKLFLSFSTNDFSYEKLDSRVTYDEFKELLNQGQLNIDISQPIKSNETLDIGYISMPGGGLIKDTSCNLEKNTKGCTIRRYNIKIVVLNLEQGAIGYEDKKILFPAVSPDNLELFILDRTRNKFVLSNAELSLFKEHKGDVIC